MATALVALATLSGAANAQAVNYSLTGPEGSFDIVLSGLFPSSTTTSFSVPSPEVLSCTTTSVGACTDIFFNTAYNGTFGNQLLEQIGFGSDSAGYAFYFVPGQIENYGSYTDFFTGYFGNNPYGAYLVVSLETPVPEPASFAALIVGLATVGYARRRRAA
jgi:hypothetical protein